MANKVLYNGVSYDILNAITLANRDYIILMDSNNIGNLTFLEHIVENGEKKYTLPPKSYNISDNQNANLKRLQLSFIVNLIIKIIMEEFSNANLRTKIDINSKFNEIKSFIYTDLTTKSIIEDQKNLDVDNFSKISEFLEKYLNKQFIVPIKNEQKKQYNYLDRPIITDEGLDTEWLYELDSNQLEALASSGRTSRELIYISDALNKRKNSDQAINNYVEMGHVKTLKKPDRTAAFVDAFLLTAITASFGLLLLLSIF